MRILRFGDMVTRVVLPMAMLALVGSQASAQHYPRFIDESVNVRPGDFPLSVTSQNVNAAPIAGSTLGGTNSDNLNIDIVGPQRWTDIRHNEGDIALGIHPAPPFPAPPMPANDFKPGDGTGDTEFNAAWGVNHGTGIAIATTRVNGRDNLDFTDDSQTTAVGTYWGYALFTNSFSSAWDYSTVTGQMGNGGGRQDLNWGQVGDRDEATHDIGAAFFPYGEGWVGGLINSDGGLLGGGGNTVSYQVEEGVPAKSPKLATVIDPNTDAFQAGTGTGVGVNIVDNPGGGFSPDWGVFDVTLGAGKEASDGMLFVQGLDGDDGEAGIVGATPTATGWRVTSRDNFGTATDGFSDISPSGTGQDDRGHFNFLYIDFDSPNLIGARIDGGSGDAVTGQTAGSYTLDRTAAGTYELQISGANDDTGMLLLSNADSITASVEGESVLVADRAILSYEWDDAAAGGSGAFVIKTVEGAEPKGPGTQLSVTARDADFYFAYIDHANPVRPVSETMTSTGSGGYEAFATWSGGTGVPTYADTASVAAGHTVDVDDDTINHAGALAGTLNVSGTVNASGTGELFVKNTINVNSGGSLNVSGSAVARVINSEVNVAAGGTLTTSGDLDIAAIALNGADELIGGTLGAPRLTSGGGTITPAGSLNVAAGGTVQFQFASAAPVAIAPSSTALTSGSTLVLEGLDGGNDNSGVKSTTIISGSVSGTFSSVQNTLGTDLVAATGIDRHIGFGLFFRDINYSSVSVDLLNAQPGDANGDGTTDSSDFTILTASFGLAGQFGWTEGNFDNSGSSQGIVDSSDFTALTQTFGSSNEDLAAEGTAHGHIAADGSIILDANAVAGYKFFIGDLDTGEELTDTGALSGQVNFISPFTLHEDRLPDSFFEGAGANALSAENLDTGVDLDISALAASGLFLQFQTQGNAPIVVPVVIPEPSSLALLGLAALGLIAFRRRRTA